VRAIDSKKALRALRVLSKEAGLDFVVLKSKGKGSHQALIFQMHEGGERLQLIIPGHSEISPGVQRSMISYVEQQHQRGIGIATIIGEILSAVFNP
jgi:methionine salvage enolase-phosphatase E1